MMAQKQQNLQNGGWLTVTGKYRTVEVNLSGLDETQQGIAVIVACQIADSEDLFTNPEHPKSGSTAIAEPKDKKFRQFTEFTTDYRVNGQTLQLRTYLTGKNSIFLRIEDTARVKRNGRSKRKTYEQNESLWQIASKAFQI